MFSKYRSKVSDVESEKKGAELGKKNLTVTEIGSDSVDEEEGSTTEVRFTHRSLNSRTINLIAISGSVGTALFITISRALLNGGPLNLLLAFTLWSGVTLCVITSIGEMVCYLPITAPFIQMAGRCVDDSFELIAGMNYWLMCSIYVPFEITAVNGMINFWSQDYSPAITFCIQIFIYTALNLFAVRWFGETEFWLSIGKVILCISLMFFTFITMVGGNPQHDAFGFRHWRDPGPMVEYLTTGSMGHFHGFMAALNIACFTIVGPEYLCMVAGEAGGETRKVLAKSFKTVFFRLVIFYIGGALSVGIILASDDPTLKAMAATGSTSNAAFSPYVIAMDNLKIKVFPHIVNALCVTSSFSAGNSLVYCSSRSLLSLAKTGFAPKFFQYCTKSGVPIFCVGVAFLFSLLSLLQLGSSSAQVLAWMVNITTGAQLLNYLFMCVTYFCFWRACNVQGIDRTTFRYRSWFQPYTIIFPFVLIGCMIIVVGYTCFMPGNWNVETFITSYLILFLDIVVFWGYKLIKKTKFKSPGEVDLITGLDEIEQHELNYLEECERKGKNVNPSLLQKIENWLF